MKLVKLQGIIIKEVNTGEADKILTIFSKKIGKIQAVARGARRPRSRLISGTQFLCFSDFVLVKGKELYEVRSCELIESFYNIRTDLKKLTYASHIVDLINEVSEENISYPKLIPLFLNTLYILANTEKNPLLVIRIFELRLMSIIGFQPQVIECVKCESNKHLIYFSPEQGGVICQSCGVNDSTVIEISESTLSSLKFIIFSEIKKIFNFNVSESVLDELSLISQKFIEIHISNNFDKLKFLDIINRE